MSQICDGGALPLPPQYFLSVFSSHARDEMDCFCLDCTFSGPQCLFVDTLVAYSSYLIEVAKNALLSFP
jgi:hypothetical protein